MGGWQISGSGGHCMGGDSNKGFAVAKVVPPEPVQGCPSLCVFMGHVPHPGATCDGHDEISQVCGGAEQQCMVAMADWNTADIWGRWQTLEGHQALLSQMSRHVAMTSSSTPSITQRRTLSGQR